MEIENYYNNIKKLDYNLMFNRNNFNIYENNQNIFLLSGILDVNKDKLIKHLLDNKQLLEIHSSILEIKEYANNLRYMKIKLNSKYIDYPLIDRIEFYTTYKNKNMDFVYSLIKDIPFDIKEKQCLEFVRYIEKGCILTTLKEININSTKIEIFIAGTDIDPILKPAIMKNFVTLLNELRHI